MLPKRQRLDLRSKQSFFEEAEKQYSELFTIYFRKKDQDLSTDQAAVIVRKKDFKKAVERKKMTRKARAALMPLLGKRGLEMVVVLNRSARETSVEQLNKKIKETISNLKK